MLEDIIKRISEEEAFNDGFRLNETRKNLTELDEYAPYPPITGYSELSGGQGFTKELANSLLELADEYHLSTQDMSFPRMKFEKPLVSPKSVQLSFIAPSLRALSGVFLLSHNEDGKAVFTAKDGSNTEDEEVAECCIQPKWDKELHNHLNNGYCAYILVEGFNVRWLSVPDYFLMKAWDEEQRLYRAEIRKWVYLKESIRTAEMLEEALEQQIKLKALPFSWRVDIKDVISGLKEGSNGDGQKKNTVYHLRLNEDFDDGRLQRHKNEYLCSEKERYSNYSESDYVHKCMLNGFVAKVVPYKITCKTCLKRIDSILARQNNK